MLQNPRKTLGFKKNMVYKIPPGGGGGKPYPASGLQDANNTNDPQKKYRLGTVSKNILLEGLNQFHGANLALSSDVDQDTKMFSLHTVFILYAFKIIKTTFFQLVKILKIM